MKKISEMEDYLRPEYDFSKLKVVARGPARGKAANTTVTLANDVAELFPTSEAVNEALRLLARAAKKSARPDPVVGQR
ncbi:MAG: hypothetical protein ACKVQJ_02455 [Pyrinomonadaceae bacterium]